MGKRGPKPKTKAAEIIVGKLSLANVLDMLDSGMKHGEIARIACISVGTVHQALHRWRRRQRFGVR